MNVALNKPEDEHSKYSPSQLPRLIRCPGSALIHESQRSSSFAIEGTQCHEITYDHLVKRNFVVDEEHPLILGFNDESRDELVEAIQECISFTQVLLEKHPDAIVKLETRVYMEGYSQALECPGLKDTHGTVDLLIIVPSLRRIYVIDWKYGAGIEVWPDSEQLKTYGLAAIGDPIKMARYDDIYLIIGQPRLYSGERFKELVLRPLELYEWAQTVLAPAINLISAKAEIFNPSEKACQWCSAKMKCEHRLAQANKDAATIFSVYSSLPDKVTTEQLLAFQEASKHFLAYSRDVDRHIYRELMTGKEVPGLKLVRGKSTRRWVKAKAFVQWASINMPDAEIFESKPLSPAKAERLFKGKIAKREDFQALIIKPEGAPTIVLEKDARPAIVFSDASEVFKDFADEESED